MPGASENLAVSSVLVNLSGLPFGNSEGRFYGLAFTPASATAIADLGNGFLGVDFGAIVASPGGANGQLQFNDAGVFGGASDFVYNTAGSSLRFGGVTNYGAAGGSNFAQVGTLRFKNSVESILTFRDAADLTDLTALAKSANQLLIGTDAGFATEVDTITADAASSIAFHVNIGQKVLITTTGLVMNDSIPIVHGTTNPATAGDVRTRNAFTIQGRNTTNAANLPLLTFAGDGIDLGSNNAAQSNIRFLTPATGSIRHEIGGQFVIQMNSTTILSGMPIVGFASQPSPYGVHGLTTKAMADANQTLSAAEYSNTIIELTGALTANRNVRLPTPTSDSPGAFWKVIRNTCTNGGAATGVVVELAAGTTVTVLFGTTAIVGALTTGIIRLTADAVH